MPVDQGVYDDDPIRWGVIATLFWGIAGCLAGLYIALQLAFPALNLSLEYTTFGRLRPLHTSADDLRLWRQCADRDELSMSSSAPAARGSPFPALARFVFWGYQLFIVLAGDGLSARHHRGASEYAEPEWYVDLWLTIVWVAYLAVFVGTIVKRRSNRISMWRTGSTSASSSPWRCSTSSTTSRCRPASSDRKAIAAFAGVQDALTQWWYGHNAVGFFLTAGFLAMMYYFVPKQAERPVYSYRLSIIHFWSLIFLYIWAGPHHLHYTALPDWAQTLGMVFSVMLWMPSWGGMINGLMTLNGAWDKIRTDPIIRMMVMALAFYGMSTFEGPMMSIKCGQLAVALYRLDDRPCPFGRARLERHDHLRGDLLPDAARCWGRERLYIAAHGQLALLARDRSASSSTPPSMWVAGIMQGLMWREYGADGYLVYSFAESVAGDAPHVPDPGRGRQRCTSPVA